jgi:hypothetical protein
MIRAEEDRASAFASDATVKIVTPSVNRSRRPNRSAERPPSSKNPPKVSVYAVTTHCKSEVLKCRLRAIAGSATFVTVASRMTMNWARHTVTMSAVLECAVTAD